MSDATVPLFLRTVTCTSPVGTTPVDDSTWSVAFAATAGFTGFGATLPVVVDRAWATVRRTVPADAV